MSFRLSSRQPILDPQTHKTYFCNALPRHPPTASPQAFVPVIRQLLTSEHPLTPPRPTSKASRTTCGTRLLELLDV